MEYRDCLFVQNFAQGFLKCDLVVLTSILGSLLTIHGVVTFTSSKSLEVQVLVDAEHPFEQDFSKHRAVEAFFTFVSLDKHRNVQPVEELRVSKDSPNCSQISKDIPVMQ